ncbi:DUF3102 domain-containing protein [Dendronalium sp. ChiSLP03b]|uniref:DUF3102 domain-containing protein n=1 Tax=Dendronalium sp. ChiSLP03b TaxID=3075381 RepID=UPI00391DA35C
MNLSEIAININDTFDRSKEFYETGINAIKQALVLDKECGDLLIQAKQNLPHGAFIPWIEANCKFSRSHAHRLMSIAKNWQKIMQSWEDKCLTRGTFEAPILSLRTALAIVSAEPKQEASSSEPLKTYKVAQPKHSCYGEVVEVVKELNHGDILVCKTSKGEFPFLKNELVAENQPLKVEVAEIIDVEVEDNSDKLREAIAIMIEFLPELQLRAILSQVLFTSRDYLPSDIQSMATKLISQEVAVLTEAL